MSAYRLVCRLDMHRSPVAELMLRAADVGGDRLTIKAGGELDPATADQLTAFVDRLIRLHRPPHVTLDLSALTFCSAAGVRALQRARSAVVAHGGDLMLHDPAPAVLKVLTITGDLGRFQIRSSALAPA